MSVSLQLVWKSLSQLTCTQCELCLSLTTTTDGQQTNHSKPFQNWEVKNSTDKNLNLSQRIRSYAGVRAGPAAPAPRPPEVRFEPRPRPPPTEVSMPVVLALPGCFPSASNVIHWSTCCGNLTPNVFVRDLQNLRSLSTGHKQNWLLISREQKTHDARHARVPGISQCSHCTCYTAAKQRGYSTFVCFLDCNIFPGFQYVLFHTEYKWFCRANPTSKRLYMAISSPRRNNFGKILHSWLLLSQVKKFS